MISIHEAIIVEGRYDKTRLSSFIDAVIIVVNGFGIYKDREKQKLIRYYAEKTGVIIMTDSDMAGFRIRGYLKGMLKGCKVKNVYIPDIFGKESRKSSPSAEGKLGVEGIDNDIILQALKRAGVCTESEAMPHDITTALLVELGLSGCQDSSLRRKKLTLSLNYPERLTTPALLELLNLNFSADTLTTYVNKLFNDQI